MRKQAEVETVGDVTSIPIIEKISFGGIVSVTDADDRKGYKGRLFWAETGDLIYSKIRVKQGSLAIVPSEIGRIAVSAEYPVYFVRPDVADTQYIALVLHTKPFLRLLDGLAHGGSTKTRIPPEDFERLEIPFPPLDTQRAIVARWQQAQAEIAAANERVKKLEDEIPLKIYEALGVPTSTTNQSASKYMVLQWAELERWSFNYMARLRQGLVGFIQSKYPIVPLCQCAVDTMNGYCIKPVTGPTSHHMLKLNALTPAGLDLRQIKYVKVSEKVAKNFCIHQGDLMICRSVGSYSHVAKCAVVDQDRPDILFPDIMIRVRLNESVLPEYVREVIQTPLGRSYFQSNARTAVGMWKIGAEDIQNFPLPLPPLDVQRDIVRRVEAGRAEIARERESAQRRACEAEAEVEALILGTSQL